MLRNDAAEHVGLRSSLYSYEYGEWDAADGWSFPLCELKIESVEAFQIKKKKMWHVWDTGLTEWSSTSVRLC